jgi:succinate dehydrogenase (ubiquinone) cytochrome b560 subunit
MKPYVAKTLGYHAAISNAHFGNFNDTNQLWKPIFTLSPTYTTSTLLCSFSNTPENKSIPTLEIDAFKRSKEFNRPISPHLTIYQPQLTWYMSALHRITGVAVGGGEYLRINSGGWGYFGIDEAE